MRKHKANEYLPNIFCVTNILAWCSSLFLICSIFLMLLSLYGGGVSKVEFAASAAGSKLQDGPLCVCLTIMLAPGCGRRCCIICQRKHTIYKR